MSTRNMETLMAERYLLDKQIKREKQRMHINFCEQNKKFLRFVDIMVILLFFMNFASLFITNSLVVKQEPEIEFVETNPAVASVGQYKTAENANIILSLLVYHAIWWAILTTVFVFMRKTMYGVVQLYLLCFCLFYLVFTVGHAFFNDLGYFVGTLL